MITNPIGFMRGAVGGGGPPPLISSFAVAPTDGAMRNDAYTVGFEFSVTSNRTIVQFGRFYAPTNVSDHLIKLWTGANVLLVTETILAASASDADGMKKVTLATPYALVAGLTYRIAMQEWSGDTWKDLWSPSMEAGFNRIAEGYGSPPSTALDNVGPPSGATYSTPAMFFTIP